MKKIIHAVHIHEVPMVVYAALTTARGLSSWWTRLVTVESEVGGRIHFRFTDVFNPIMVQQTLEQDRLVEWTCVGGHENWADNSFSFALEERREDTLLMFTQNYAQELSDEMYGTYNFNWGYYLHSLKRYCEANEGTPFTPPKIA
ncbi:MAG TPA: SRPBCC domain-containing protein [Candidatus Kapabacteria bacterium]|nr:SRPBCC domain-containing protein [Candidatus Kapabacteria bacterium]